MKTQNKAIDDMPNMNKLEAVLFLIMLAVLPLMLPSCHSKQPTIITTKVNQTETIKQRPIPSDWIENPTAGIVYEPSDMEVEK